AQVKSAILLAALGAEGETKVREGAPTRDHTERMLKAMGANITSTHSAPDARSDGEARVVSLTAGPLAPIAISVPGDFSSAAFFIVAAWLARDADVRIEAVGLNPTRTGLLDIARMMGASATVEALREEHDEPVGDLLVRPAAGLCGVVIDGDLVPRAIDEFPLVALLATQADGETVVRGAQELRVKESDRVASVVLELRKMGAQIEERADGFVVNGPTRLCGARVDSHGDHRLAMMLAVAGLIADGETLIDGSACISKSFPDFERTLAALVSR
ncbi:MAG: 3-phosphoshikimate 1-carboxyvinyltransferase, partial [Chloroflexi bacterium]|nr:3-phosphoshikimate 1-carboxyvinyltransferase [Chloroflexota bacterium]